MNNRRYVLRIILPVVLLICFSSALAIGYAYWDSSTNTQNNTVNIGDWGTPITTPQEFYDFATKTNSSTSDHYYLFNDIDFSGYNWVYNSSKSSVVFRGILDGNGKTISNLSLNYTSMSYQYFGIFPRMQGGAIYNLTLSNVFLNLSTTALYGTSLRSGLLTGNVYGSTNIFSNITIIDCGVRGTSSTGSGGLIGSVTTGSTIVNINNIKATNLKVFNKSANAGGLIGSINSSGATVTINDIDLQGEVFSNANSSYTGGIVGNIVSGGKLTVNRAIIDMTSQNTLETSTTYRNKYTVKYLGGFIGRNQSSRTNVFLTDVFFTGSLYPQSNNNRSYVGTLIGTTGGSYTSTRAYYSNVTFRSSNGSFITTPDTTCKGIMAPSVTADNPWWNEFKTNFDLANGLWAQDSDGRLYLVR